MTNPNWVVVKNTLVFINLKIGAPNPPHPSKFTVFVETLNSFYKKKKERKKELRKRCILKKVNFEFCHYNAKLSFYSVTVEHIKSIAPTDQEA